MGPAPDSGRTRDLWRGPLYYADHHGDFIVLIDSHPGMSVVWGAEGAQVRAFLSSDRTVITSGLRNVSANAALMICGLTAEPYWRSACSSWISCAW